MTETKRVDNRPRYTARRRGRRVFTQTVSFNVSEDQFDVIDKAALESGVSKGEYLRSIIFPKTVVD